MLSERRTRLIGYALIILAILVQLQATIPIGGTVVRANAADIALAALAPLILIVFFSKIVRLKEIAGTQLLVLVVAATLILSFSLFRGYGVMSGLSSWAAIKYAGWYILLYYLALGVLIAIMTGPEGKERFALGFICYQVAIIIAFLVTEVTGHRLSLDVGGRLTGFAGNTNAMAFYLICGFALALAYFRRTGLSPRKQLAVLFTSGLLMAGILFTKSIATLIALASVLLFAAIIHAITLKRLVKIVALGLAIWMTPQVILERHSWKNYVAGKAVRIVTAATSATPAGRNDSQYKASVQVRMEGYRDAVVMWRESPVFGSGLGVHLHRQSLREKPAYLPHQIHNTGLWLLAETGLAGFLAIAGAFILLFHKVWRLARSPPDESGSDAWFQYAVLLILVGWAVTALFGELMYQRVGWLITGMALIAPVEPLVFWKWNQARGRDSQE